MHLALLGDSIFDNAKYVPGKPAVIEQVRARLRPGEEASLLAVDGHVISDMQAQINEMASHGQAATHLAVSIGGNNVLRASGIMDQKAKSVRQVFQAMAQVQDEFQTEYMLLCGELLQLGLPTVVCTIYDYIPGLPDESRCALSLFNDMIVQCAFSASFPVIDLRDVCDQDRDYSTLSPIEPSCAGGAKIAEAIMRVCREHDFTKHVCTIYGRPEWGYDENAEAQYDKRARAKN